MMGNRWPSGRFSCDTRTHPPFPRKVGPIGVLLGLLPAHPLCNDRTGESAESMLGTPWRPEPVRKLGGSDRGTRSDATPVGMSKDSASRRSGSTLTQGVTVRPGGGLLARVRRCVRAPRFARGTYRYHLGREEDLMQATPRNRANRFFEKTDLKKDRQLKQWRGTPLVMGHFHITSSTLLPRP